MIVQDQPTIFDDTKLRCIVSSKEDGNTRPEWGPLKETQEVIGRMAQRIGLGASNVVVMDVGAHKGVWDEIVDITQPEGRGVDDPAERVAADAVVTQLPGVGLLLPVGDCNAVAVHDPVRNVLAVVHLGRQSAVAELAAKVIDHLKQKYQTNPADLRIYVSPAVKEPSYILRYFDQVDEPQWKSFSRKTDEGVYINLPGYIRQQFIDSGVPAEHIQVCPVDTVTSDKYFSHYRAKRNGEPEGRFALLASLK